MGLDRIDNKLWIHGAAAPADHNGIFGGRHVGGCRGFSRLENSFRTNVTGIDDFFIKGTQRLFIELGQVIRFHGIAEMWGFDSLGGVDQ